MQTVEYTTFGTANSGAYSFHPGLQETVSPDEAKRLVDLGYAKIVASATNRLFETLKEANAGLLYTAETDPDFVEAAKQAGLLVRKK